MPSITKEQIIKLQSQAPNGWKFDWRHYVIHGEKTLTHKINLDNGRYLEARVYYSEIYINRYVPTGTHEAKLHVSLWAPTTTEGVYHSNGFGKSKVLSEGPFPRKNYKELCKIAGSVFEDDVLNLQANM